jgi:anaerobic ribonucleoside-triphosphate reductase activating protein
LKYIGYDIVFQEVPDEVSLAINISGCPHKCEGCHSQYLWKYDGEYVDDQIDNLLANYKNMITCVCFMGGDQNMNNFENLLINIKMSYRLKTCLYTGSNDLNKFNPLLPLLNYIKIGSYKKELGGLDHITTNQRFYKIENENLFDITYKFQNKKGN